jgi:AAA domain
LSAGLPFPDGFPCEPAGVVLISAEDGLADTIRPRLDAAGADTSKIVALATAKGKDGHERLISIPEDIPLIERAARRVKAKLVVVDPLMAFLSSNANSHRDQDVRRALAPLAKMAERLGAAVVVIRHLNKGTHPNPLYRGGGSIGIIGAARMGFLVAKDPQDEERRVLAPTKNNLAKAPKSLAFALKGTQSGAVRVEWLGESGVSVEELLATPRGRGDGGALGEAIEFLEDVLSDGPFAAGGVKEEAEDAGISGRTLARAKKELGVESYREGERGGRGKGQWLWKLAEVDLVEGGDRAAKDAEGAPSSNDGILNRGGGDEEAEPCMDREEPLRMPSAGREPLKDAEPVKDARAPALGKGGGLNGGGVDATKDADQGNLKVCGHGYPNGKGCYLCDPDHLFRKQGGAP